MSTTEGAGVKGTSTTVSYGGLDAQDSDTRGDGAAPAAAAGCKNTRHANDNAHTSSGVTPVLIGERDTSLRVKK